MCAHPSFHYSSEEARTQIAELYAKFGMTVFWDMLPRAEAIRKAKDDMENAKNAYLTAEAACQESAYLREDCPGWEKGAEEEWVRMEIRFYLKIEARLVI